MKKSLSYSVVGIVLLLGLLVTSCSKSTGETIDQKGTSSPLPFSVRDGVTFLQSMEEVSKIEQNHGISLTQQDDLYTTGKISIAGYDDSWINYYFSENNQLTTIDMYFNPQKGYETLNHMEKSFFDIEDGLKKYDGYSVQIPSTLKGNSLSKWYDSIAANPPENGNSAACGKSGRLIQTDNGYVYIDHVCMLAGKLPLHFVAYTYYTNEEISNLIAEQATIQEAETKEQQEIQESKSNDL